MHPLLAVVAFLVGLAVSTTPAAFADTCTNPTSTAGCAQACTSWDTCLHCCAQVDASTADCKNACVGFLTAHRRRGEQPPTTPAVNQRLPHRLRPTPTSTPSQPAHLSASCSLEQTSSRVVISLQVQNDSSVDVTSLVPQTPSLQLDAGSRFVLARTSSPRSVAVLHGGAAVVFRWYGRLSSGAAGISASARATGPGGESVTTPQVDCGTVGQSQPQPTQGSNNPPSASECLSCHSSPLMTFVVSKWTLSTHAQAGVGCPSCHASDAQRAAWGTPIATYDAASGAYTPVPLWDADQLCTHCHTGDHAPGFQGYGEVMHLAGVRCMDCHMAQIPSGDPSVGDRAAHDFKVAANLPYSCGTFPGGCHSRRPVTWAARVLNLGPMHGQ